MKISQLAAQLYTVRDLCKTPAETAATLKEIGQIGFQAVEVAGICEIAPTELVKMAQDAGVAICAYHGDLNATLQQPAKVAADLAALGADYGVYSYPAGFNIEDPASVTDLIGQLVKSEEVFRAGGKTLCYHHHSLEFVRHGEGTVLDRIAQETRLSIELDTYWVQHGGGNIVEWCEKLNGRLPVLHMKDYGIQNHEPTMKEIGSGNLRWPQILLAAETAGCQWFVVEQDTCPGHPLDSLRKSFAFCQTLLS